MVLEYYRLSPFILKLSRSDALYFALGEAFLTDQNSKTISLVGNTVPIAKSSFGMVSGVPQKYESQK